MSSIYIIIVLNIYLTLIELFIFIYKSKMDLQCVTTYSVKYKQIYARQIDRMPFTVIRKTENLSSVQSVYCPFTVLPDDES